MSAFSLWFKTSSEKVHVCFLFPQADMIEIEDNAERCGLLSFSLLSQNHQKWRSTWRCVPVSLSGSKSSKCTSATSKHYVLSTMCFLALSLLSQTDQKLRRRNEMSLSLSVSELSKVATVHCMCGSGSSVAGVIKRQRGCVHVFSVSLSFLSKRPNMEGEYRMCPWLSLSQNHQN